jgi:cystathionine beta-lyase
MNNDGFSKLTQSVHAGSQPDPIYKGMVTPVYPSSAYDYEGTPNGTLYPRYFNTPNQVGVAKKLAALENGEEGLVFSSGMAAILTSLLANLKQGDHAIFQNDLYGGTYHAVVKEFARFGIEYSFVDGSRPNEFENAIRKNTKIIYVETPSNPTLKITPLKAVAEIARRKGIITIIDNTFASPVNQNPMISSATVALSISVAIATSVAGQLSHLELISRIFWGRRSISVALSMLIRAGSWREVSKRSCYASASRIQMH